MEPPGHAGEGGGCYDEDPAEGREDDGEGHIRCGKYECAADSEADEELGIVLGSGAGKGQ